MQLFTIGFTGTSAEDFFARLTRAHVKTVLDVRLHNTSQLAGFAKVRDLPWLLKTTAGIRYAHHPILAPTPEMLTAYHSGPGTREERWPAYAAQFTELMRERKIERHLDPAALNCGCLLCTEAKPHFCHRRLVAEYLAEHWSMPIEIEHL
jgi:uncharacterized protein (DUF488 family)